MDWVQLVHGTVHVKASSGSIKGEEFLDQLSDSDILTMDSGPLS
jgi:hypothetical protein